jgi:hypothetical protein
MGTCSGLDGFIARRFDQRSVLGSYLDPLSDKLLINSMAVACMVHSGRTHRLIVLHIILPFRLWILIKIPFARADRRACAPRARGADGPARRPPGCRRCTPRAPRTRRASRTTGSWASRWIAAPNPGVAAVQVQHGPAALAHHDGNRRRCLPHRRRPRHASSPVAHRTHSHDHYSITR